MNELTYQIIITLILMSTPICYYFGHKHGHEEGLKYGKIYGGFERDQLKHEIERLKH